MRYFLCVATAIVLIGCSGSGDAPNGASGNAVRGSEPAASTTVVASTAAGDPVTTRTGPVPSPTDFESHSITSAVLASSDAAVGTELVEVSEQIEADLLAQATAATQPQGFRRADRPPLVEQAQPGLSGMGAMGVLVDLVSRLTSSLKTQNSTSFESTANTTSATGSGSLGFGAKMSGDGAGSTTVELSLEVKAETADGKSVSHRIKGSVTGPSCPDEAGHLDLDFTGEIEVVTDGDVTSRSRHTFTSTANAVYDDNAEMADVDIELDVQSDRIDVTGRSAFVDATFGYRVGNMFSTGTTTVDERPIVENRTSQSVKSAPQQADREMIFDGERAALEFVGTVLAARRASIQNNGCVMVKAEAPTTVGPQQVVPVNVSTQHVIDGVALDKRVDATLTGEGSLDPTTLAKTPDKVTYTAGQKSGDAGTIEFVSRSRRGIGTTTLTITVASKYRVDSAAGALRIEGPVCSLDEPFTLSVVGEINGSLTFTPSGAQGGSYSGGADMGRGSMSWSGPYTLSGRDTDAPTVRIEEGTTTLDPVGGIPNFWGGGVDLALIPDAAACP